MTVTTRTSLGKPGTVNINSDVYVEVSALFSEEQSNNSPSEPDQAPASNSLQSKDAASERRAQSHLARLMPLQTFSGDLQKPRGAWEGHDHRTCPGQGTADLELAGATDGIANTKVEALETWSQGHAERGPVLLLQNDPIEGKHGPRWLPREMPCKERGGAAGWRGRGTCEPEREELALKLLKPL
jgi:hypothetical protein